MYRPTLALLAAVAAVLSACAGGGVDGGAASTTVPPAVGLDPEMPTHPATGSPPTGAVTPAETTVTTADEGPPVVLRGDGLGAHRFGAGVDEVIAGLTLRWGPPGTDTGWMPAATSPDGVCPGSEVRVVGWGEFRVFFSDGPTPHGPAARRHFFTWDYRVDDPAAPRPDPGGNRPPLHTEPGGPEVSPEATGISVGASVAELQRAYGDRLELFDEPPSGPSFGVQLADGGLLFGSLTSLDAGGVVVSMTGGGGCGE